MPRGARFLPLGPFFTWPALRPALARTSRIHWIDSASGPEPSPSGARRCLPWNLRRAPGSRDAFLLDEGRGEWSGRLTHHYRIQAGEDALLVLGYGGRIRSRAVNRHCLARLEIARVSGDRIDLLDGSAWYLTGAACERALRDPATRPFPRTGCLATERLERTVSLPTWIADPRRDHLRAALARGTALHHLIARGARPRCERWSVAPARHDGRRGRVLGAHRRSDARVVQARYDYGYSRDVLSTSGPYYYELTPGGWRPGVMVLCSGQRIVESQRRDGFVLDGEAWFFSAEACRRAERRLRASRPEQPVPRAVHGCAP
jgi:hypothetical protein